MRVASLAALLLAAGLVGLRSQPKCGTDRWPVKVWEDADAGTVDTSPRWTTVRELAALETPEMVYPANGRLAPVERQRYRVRAEIARLSTEADGDWHIILRDLEDRRRTIIAEVPDPRCVKSTTLQAVYAAVRDSLRRVPRQGIATVDGIGFWDFIHTQSGGAANGIELHPVLLVVPEQPTVRRDSR
jgi:hypothetical protein